MARIKKTITTSQSRSPRREIFSSANSYKSLLYGIATVIILFILGFSLAQMFLNRPSPEIDNGAVSVSRIEEALNKNKDTDKEAREASGGGTYTVQVNDSLWSIAEAKYNDGYAWLVIARANNISSPNTIFQGDKLAIPLVFSKSALKTSGLDTSVDTRITSKNVQVGTSSSTYVVKRGDNLWSIAVIEYGDGYMWSAIAKENNLTNPGLIHADNVLKLPR